MIKNLIFALVLLITTNFYAQINFEKGYFIDNTNTKTVCYIKNEDKASNPTVFYYKNSLENNEEGIKSIESVKEFGIDNFSRYERHEVQIDMSSTDISKLSLNRNPEWSTKTVFLKLIADGDAKLYQYVDEFVRSYFYSYKKSKVEQLVYKQYHSDVDGIVFENIQENKYFHQQLWNTVKCTQTTSKRISRLSYKQNDLVAYFEEVNNCDGSKSIDLAKTKGFMTDGLVIKVKAGMNFNSFTIKDVKDNSVKNLGGQSTYGFGAEFEYVLPFSRNKFSLYLEPTYQSKYEAKQTFVKVYNFGIIHDYNWEVKYQSIDLTLGGKYKAFLTNSANLFFNLGGTYNIVTDGTIIVDGIESEDMVSSLGFTLGVGVEYKRFNLEARMNNRTTTSKGLIFDSEGKYKNVSLVLGYKIFETNKKK